MVPTVATGLELQAQVSDWNQSHRPRVDQRAFKTRSTAQKENPNFFRKVSGAAKDEKPGCLIGQPGLGTVLGFVAIIFATINVVGGFMVTDRMLEMFKKKGDE